MIEMVGDIWKIAAESSADAVCVTTNGIINGRGELVMGRGTAREAALRYPALPRLMANWVSNRGNCVGMFAMRSGDPAVVSYPTKWDWRLPSDLALIKASAIQLEQLADSMQWQTVVLPRPGCGAGGLDWRDVKTLIDGTLDSRFIVANKGR